MSAHREVTIPDGFKELLQEFTVAVLRRSPDDVLQFAIDFFTEKKATEDEAPSSAHDDDEEEDMPPPPVNRPSRRVAVAAESWDPEKEDDDGQERLVYPKSDEQKAQLSLAVQHILLFRCLDEDQMVDVIDAMFEKRAEPGEKVIEQGDDGDNFYVIGSGLFDIYVKINGVDTKVGQYDNKGSFGELALMYNTPRAATIVASTPGVLWAMDRATFRRIVLKKAFQKRIMYETLLENVPLLKELSSYERMNVADALRTRIYEPGSKIISQGEAGTEMYFLEDGAVRVMITDAKGEEKMVTQLTKGGYFGELALLTKHPRAASVYATERTKLAVLDVESFERLLGPCLDIMSRNISEYEDQLKSVFGTLENLPEMRQ